MDNKLTKNLKVLCIGDSLALPGHGNRFEDTWFYKLQEHFTSYVFASYFKRATTMLVLVSEGGGDAKFPKGSDCLEFHQPDVVIIQLGIVDCAPRYLKKSSIINKIIERMPSKLKSFSYFLIKKLTKRSIKKAELSPDQFHHYLEVYLNRCKKNNVKKVILINICSPDETVKQKSPDLIYAIDLYNKIIEEVSAEYNFTSVVNPLNSNEIDIYEDGYHPNPKGNNLVYNALKTEFTLV